MAAPLGLACPTMKRRESVLHNTSPVGPMVKLCLTVRLIPDCGRRQMAELGRLAILVSALAGIFSVAFHMGGPTKAPKLTKAEQAQKLCDDGVFGSLYDCLPVSWLQMGSESF
jgi:hypothetical protein